MTRIRPHAGTGSALAIAAAVMLASSPSQAARPDTRAMTCQGAQQFIRSNGAVVMTTGAHTYDRIVSGLGYCGRGQETALKIVPTADNPKCRIGYYCRDRIIEPILPRLPSRNRD